MSADSLIPGDSTAAFDAARQTCRTHARSFYFASYFLPQPKRNRAYALYAFCRLLDDAVDEAASPSAVDQFERLLDDCFTGRLSVGPQSAIRAFADTVLACRIPQTHFQSLLEGCRMDFTIDRYDTWADLEKYCYRVAGVVGLIMCYVFDVTDPGAQQHAIAMGNAMQLTNILRDVREDMDRGRIYLPAEDMEQFKLGALQLTNRRWSRPFADLMRFEVARARRLYRDGANGIGYIPNDGSRLTACVMAVVYGGILGAIESVEYDVFRRRAAVSAFGKLRRLPLAVKLCRCEVGDDVPDLC